MPFTSVKKVYVFKYKDIYKIGISYNVIKRLSQLKCGCPSITLLYESDYISNPYYVEKILHDILREKKIEGEWFSDVDIDVIKGIVENIGEKINFKEAEKNANEHFTKKAKEIIELFKTPYLIELQSESRINVIDKINFDRGWKFTEDDIEFLISYYKSYATILENECSGDGLEDICLIINSLVKDGVQKSKDLIQLDAKNMVEFVNGEVYEYYTGEYSKDILRLIENSILVTD